VQKPTILFVDDDVPFLKTRKGPLEAEGYEVLCTGTLKGAKRIIKDRWIHLAIIDVRLAGGGAEATDVSGLALAREIDATIPTILITACATQEVVRSVVESIGDRRASAVDFLSKQDGGKAMLEAVRRVLRDHVRINRDLDLKLTRPSSFHALAADLERGTWDARQLAGRADEMEDIFRKLFFEHTRACLNGFRPESEGVGTVIVTAVSSRGAERFAVKCGMRKDVLALIQQSRERHIYLAQTLHYAAAAYPLRGWQRVVDSFPGLSKVAEVAASIIAVLGKIFGA
jgi:DNA-binding response OmpR family regulator